MPSKDISYNLKKLIDARYLSNTKSDKEEIHVISDIDKTYIESEFSTFLDMAKIAFEDEEDKITVSGATQVLCLLKNYAGDENKNLKFLHFVSSSPPQLRQVLEKKLLLDGLTWDSDTFKNQLYNLVSRRTDLLREHIAYKMGAILNLIAQAKPQSQFILIGDSSESDPVIYLGIKLLLEKKISVDDFQHYIEKCGIENKTIEQVLSLVSFLNEEKKVMAILIRKVKGHHFFESHPFFQEGGFYFDNYLEAALFLFEERVLSSIYLRKLILNLHNQIFFELNMILDTLSSWKKISQNSDLKSEIEKLANEILKEHSWEIHERTFQLPNASLWESNSQFSMVIKSLEEWRRLKK